MAEIPELIKKIESDENQNSEHILHRLLELAMTVTGRGDIEEDYTKTIEFPIGNVSIVSDPYYGKIWINADDGEEEIEDEKDIDAISKEIKKRLLQFDKQIKEIREKVSNDLFEKPLRRVAK